MNRIVIIGSAGTGKSTLAKDLGQILGLPVYHLDSFLWNPGWIQTPAEELDQTIKKLVLNNNWIIDGNYSRTMDIRFHEADTIIFLDYPIYLNLYRVLKRRIQYHGKTRPDMGKDCKEKIDLEFLMWILNFNRNHRLGIVERLSKVSNDKEVHIFKTPSKLKKFLVQLIEVANTTDLDSNR